MDPMKTPLPASLAAIATSARRSEKDTMLADQARQMSGMHTVAPVAEPTLVDIILVDHKQTLTLLSHAFRAAAAADAAGEGPSGGGGLAAGLLRAAAGAVALDVLLHSKAEEEVVYPAISRLLTPRGYSPEGDTPRAGLRHAMREHAELNAAAVEVLMGLQRGEEVVGDALVRVEQTFIAHQQEMETEVLPRLATHVTQEELTELAVAFRQAKQEVDVMDLLTRGLQEP